MSSMTHIDEFPEASALNSLAWLFNWTPSWPSIGAGLPEPATHGAAIPGTGAELIGVTAGALVWAPVTHTAPLAFLQEEKHH